MAAALSVPQLFDSMAIRVDGPKAWDLKAVTDWHFEDLDEHYRPTSWKTSGGRPASASRPPGMCPVNAAAGQRS